MGQKYGPHMPSPEQEQTEDIVEQKTIRRVNSDMLQNKCIKKTLGTKKRAVNNEVTGEVGAQLLFARAMERTVRCIRSVKQTQDNALVRIALVTQKELHGAGKQCWFTGYTRLTKQVGGTEFKKGEVKQKLENKYKEKWELEVKEASRLHFYTRINRI